MDTMVADNNIVFRATVNWFNDEDSLELLRHVALIRNAITTIEFDLARHCHIPDQVVEHRIARWFGNGTQLEDDGHIRKIGEVFRRVKEGIDNKTTVYWDDSDAVPTYGRVNYSFWGSRYRCIQLGEKYFRGTQADRIGTLIHELTHLYAGTSDHGYFDNPDSLLASNPVTYYEARDPYGPIRLTAAQQVENADSYAGFLVQFYI